MHKDVVHPRLSPSSWWAQHRSKKKSKGNKSTSSTGHRRAQTRYQQSLTIANQTLADHSLSWLSTNWGRCLLHRWNTWSEFCRHHWKAYRILANSSKWTKHFKRVDTCSIRSRARGCKLGGRVTATELFFRLFSSNHRGKLKDLRVSKPPRTNLVDIGAVVDWLQFQFIYFRNVKSSLAVLHNQNDMVIHSRPAGCLKSEPRDGMSSKKKKLGVWSPRRCCQERGYNLCRKWLPIRWPEALQQLSDFSSASINRNWASASCLRFAFPSSESIIERVVSDFRGKLERAVSHGIYKPLLEYDRAKAGGTWEDRVKVDDFDFFLLAAAWVHPGRNAFSQLSSGVKDAMVRCTKL